MIELIDGHAHSLKYPATFHLPAGTDALAPGDFVKLMFRGSEGVERMWVKVTGKDGPRYLGEVANRPISLTDIGLGEDRSVTMLADRVEADLERLKVQ